MKRMIVLLGFSCFLLINLAYAGLPPLPADQAFALQVERVSANQLQLQWAIAPGYYLYRDQIKIKPNAGNQVTLGAIALPQGHLKQDSLRGRYQVFANQLIIKVPVLTPTGQLRMTVHYQGCATQGFCYSPIDQVIDVYLPPFTASQDLTAQLKAAALPSHGLEANNIASLLADQGFFIIVATFLGLGILLSLTPCVLPMVPILSSIILGHGKKLNVVKSFTLSLAYVLGMAIMYAVAGLVAALVGSRWQTELQRPWVIILFAGVVVILALSLLGIFHLSLPRRVKHFLHHLSAKQKAANYLGVFLMGSISSLIVSPCISPPLVGILLYIANTGNLWFGTTALLALGLGMGLPLLLVGISAGSILPKTGPWMVRLQKIMGLAMLAYAIWLVSRIMPGPVALFCWSVLMICSAFYLGLLAPAQRAATRVWRGVTVVILIYGILLMVGAFLGNHEPLHPLRSLTLQNRAFPTANFITIKNMQELDQALAQAAATQHRVLLDFYADWCVSCVRMEDDVFNKPRVQAALTDIILLRADVTANNAFDQALLKRYNVIAPPTILLFNQDGVELTDQRIIGEVSASEFIKKMKIEDEQRE